MSGGDTLFYLDGESSVGENDHDETESIFPLFNERLGGYCQEEENPVSYGLPRYVAIYMVRESLPHYDAQGNLVTASPNTSSNQPGSYHAGSVNQRRGSCRRSDNRSRRSRHGDSKFTGPGSHGICARCPPCRPGHSRECGRSEGGG